jgi:hypothetical protein
MSSANEPVSELIQSRLKIFPISGRSCHIPKPCFVSPLDPTTLQEYVAVSPQRSARRRR